MINGLIIPPLFEPVEDVYGARLALVFGNENVGGKCPFYGHQCFHCDIGAGEGVEFDPTTNEQRLSFFVDHYGQVLRNVSHLVIYNSGSILNPREFSRETLGTVLHFAASLDKARIISLDSREMYVTARALDFAQAHLRSDQMLRVILGLETQDDHTRLKVIRKTMTRRGIEQAFRNVGQCQSKGGIDINIIFQPPGWIGQAAVAEAVASAEYALSLGAQYGVPVDLNFHPYYPSSKGRQMFLDHPRAQVKDALGALKDIKHLIVKYGTRSALFVGWQDEGHDNERDIRHNELQVYQELFHSINVTQVVQWPL
jgi:hypothetical protein